MKILKFLIEHICVCFLVISSFNVIAAEDQEILLTTQDWPPYQTYIGSELTGAAVDVVRCAMEKLERPYRFEVYPWRRSQIMVMTSKAHGFFAASKSNERDEYATFSEIIAEQEWTWYLLKANKLDPKQDSFKEGAKVAAMIGSNMLSWLKNKNYKITKEHIDTEKLFIGLFDGEYDAILVNNLVAKHAINKLGLSKEQFSDVQHKYKPLGVYWSNEFLGVNPGFINNFNSMVIQCRGNISQKGEK